MADVKTIATRDSYGRALADLGAVHDDLVVFDADLSAATKTSTFKKAFPERHFNCGKGEVLQDGDDVAIIATGLMVYEAIQAGQALKEQGINARIINLATIKLSQRLPAASAEDK